MREIIIWETRFKGERKELRIEHPLSLPLGWTSIKCIDINQLQREAIEQAKKLGNRGHLYLKKIVWEFDLPKGD